MGEIDTIKERVVVLNDARELTGYLLCWDETVTAQTDVWLGSFAKMPVVLPDGELVGFLHQYYKDDAGVYVIARLRDPEDRHGLREKIRQGKLHWLAATIENQCVRGANGAMVRYPVFSAVLVEEETGETE